MSDLIKKRSPQERLIIAKTLLDGVIKDFPSAQPEPPTTTWLGNYCPYRCEHCGRYVDSKERYCPDCGRRASNYD